MNSFLLQDQLEELLSEPIASVINREQRTFDELTAPFNKSLVLFGAGGLGRKTLAGLRRLGIEPLVFADNNPALWGKKVEGVLVMSPAAAAQKFGQRAAFVITIWKGESTDRMSERRQQLEGLNCSRIVSFGPLFWKYPNIFIPHYAFDLPHKVYQQADQLRKVFSLWADDTSRYEYMAQLRWRMLLDFDELPSPVKHEIYFPDDLVITLSNEVFVDCGAYDGDTIRSFIQRGTFLFDRVIAFEPDPINFQKLQQYVSMLPPNIRDRITIYQLAIGARREKVRFDASGTEASAVGSGTLDIDCITLDEVLGDFRPTYIKMDIEGSEIEALKGARATIERTSPVLAICTYHHQDHLWHIPQLIHSMSGRYRFFLRPHLLEVWDLVCYAVPISRLRVESFERSKP